MSYVESTLQPSCTHTTMQCTKIRSDHSSTINSTYHSYGGFLGCNIYTFSGYGKCVVSSIENKEPTTSLRILTVIQGKDILWHDSKQKTINLEPGKSLLIRSTCNFNDILTSSEKSFIEVVDIRFDCQYLGNINNQILDLLKDSKLQPFIESRPWIFDTSPEIHSFAHQLGNSSSVQLSHSTAHLYTSSQAYQCLSRLLHKLEMLNSNRKQDEYVCLSSRTLSKIRKANKLIENEPSKNWSIAELCKRVGTNETSFKRGFKQLFNTTFSKHLQQTRMDVAAIELVLTDQPVIDIVYNVGYSSPSHFTKLFKQHFGQNPLQYRKCRQTA
ncbi:helix-turn-helix transcriptional regulator [Vibrio hepatarius]|uniref:helix-turn-helix transcriptional regulator n=1 Tax=Vibrio hepatarius TaxID=171383 RepID=UPI001C08F40B|nr:AraC family transcriptional regulator [Vibrio hepatarius]MBU2898679.1 AraC family transcriptional regulator [Vibrio hepatarius]